MGRDVSQLWEGRVPLIINSQLFEGHVSNCGKDRSQLWERNVPTIESTIMRWDMSELYKDMCP